MHKKNVFPASTPYGGITSGAMGGSIAVTTKSVIVNCVMPLDVPDPSAPLNTILLLVVPAEVIEFSSIVQPAITPDPVARILGRLTTEVLLPNEPDSICCIPSALKFVEEDIADVCDLIVDACDCSDEA